MPARLCTIFLVLFYSGLQAQPKEATVVYGRVIKSAEARSLRNDSYISCIEYRGISNWLSWGIFVDSNGFYKLSFQRDHRIELRTYFPDYDNVDTVINTRNKDSIRIDFHIHPKLYKYSFFIAEDHIRQGVAQLITFDTVPYKLSRRFNHTDPFHFNYQYLERPADREQEIKMYEYNKRVEFYLDSLLGPKWVYKLAAAEDSLIHLEADNYGRTHKIDITSLSVPAWHKLPEKMRETVRDKRSDILCGTGSKIRAVGLSSRYILDKIDHDSDIKYMRLAKDWLPYNYEIIPQLISRLTDTTRTGCINVHRYYGYSCHGTLWVLRNDQASVASKANELLESISGKYFGSVNKNSTPAELQKLQNRWAYWLMSFSEKKQRVKVDQNGKALD